LKNSLSAFQDCDPLLKTLQQLPTLAEAGNDAAAAFISYLIIVNNKIDILSEGQRAKLGLESNGKSLPTHSISCETGEGIEGLEKTFIETIKLLMNENRSTDPSSSDESVLITRQRHRNHLVMCVHHLDRFLRCNLPMDAAAEELRYVFLLWWPMQ
jgi:tRNA U34 5-carboxymethylaminomethyl modifying GTPase MnmE/TrmE